MDRQETIKLLDDYMSALNTKNENGARIKKLKMDMGITYDPNDGYSLIKFLWPFLVAFPVIGTFLIVLIAYLTKAEYRSEVYFSYIIGAAIYFTISVVIARLLRKSANKKLYDKRATINGGGKLTIDAKGEGIGIYIFNKGFRKETFSNN